MRFLSDLFEDLFDENVDLEAGELAEQNIEFDSQLGDFVNEDNEIQALFALDRMAGEIEGAELDEIQSYFEAKDFNPEQFQGVINNWKGIYGEIEVVEILNAQSDGEIEYKIPFDTNNPGVDIYGVDKNGDIVEKYQVKMSIDKGYINQSLKDLPSDVKLICPTEIAGDIDHIAVYDIGLSLDEVNSTIEDVCAVLNSQEPWEKDLDEDFSGWIAKTEIKGH